MYKNVRAVMKMTEEKEAGGLLKLSLDASIAKEEEVSSKVKPNFSYHCLPAEDAEEIIRLGRLKGYCYEVQEDKYKVKYVVLAKDTSDSSPPKIILTFANQWEGILNPSHSAYPQTTSLKGMKEVEAVKLFGDPTRIEGQKTFFNLVMIAPGKTRAKSDNVELEMEFNDGLITSYVVRGDLIGERDKRYPNFAGLPFKGEVYGPKFIALMQEYRLKNGVDMPADERPWLVLIGRSRDGSSLYDIPEPGQYPTTFGGRRAKELKNK